MLPSNSSVGIIEYSRLWRRLQRSCLGDQFIHADVPSRYISCLNSAGSFLYLSTASRSALNDWSLLGDDTATKTTGSPGLKLPRACTIVISFSEYSFLTSLQICLSTLFACVS